MSLGRWLGASPWALTLQLCPGASLLYGELEPHLEGDLGGTRGSGSFHQRLQELVGGGILLRPLLAPHCAFTGACFPQRAW